MQVAGASVSRAQPVHSREVWVLCGPAQGASTLPSPPSYLSRSFWAPALRTGSWPRVGGAGERQAPFPSPDLSSVPAARPSWPLGRGGRAAPCPAVPPAPRSAAVPSPSPPASSRVPLTSSSPTAESSLPACPARFPRVTVAVPEGHCVPDSEAWSLERKRGWQVPTTGTQDSTSSQRVTDACLGRNRWAGYPRSHRNLLGEHAEGKEDGSWSSFFAFKKLKKNFCRVHLGAETQALPAAHSLPPCTVTAGHSGKANCSRGGGARLDPSTLGG